MKIDCIKTQIFQFEKKEDFNFPLAEQIIEGEVESASENWDSYWFEDDFGTIASILGFDVEDFKFTGFVSIPLVGSVG